MWFGEGRKKQIRKVKIREIGWDFKRLDDWKIKSDRIVENLIEEG